jgi:hypothetical protein
MDIRTILKSDLERRITERVDLKEGEFISVHFENGDIVAQHLPAHNAFAVLEVTPLREVRIPFTLDLNVMDIVGPFIPLDF